MASNNKNIILAAEQSRTLINNKRIFVVPTTTMAQGISSALAFSTEINITENLKNMNDKKRRRHWLIQNLRRLFLYAFRNELKF